MQASARKRNDDAAAASSAPLPRRAALAHAASQLSAELSQRARSASLADGEGRKRRSPLLASLSSSSSQRASAAATPPPPAAEARRGGFGPLSLLRGGARLTLGAASGVAGLCLLPLRLPLRLLPMPRKRAPPGGAAAPLSREARERAGHALRAASAKQELGMLWSYNNAAERARVSDFFACFASPKWRLEAVHDNGTEARTPAEQLCHAPLQPWLLLPPARAPQPRSAAG